MEREQEQLEQESSVQQEETSTIQETQQTSPPLVSHPSINEDTRALFATVLREKNQELDQLRQQLNARKEEPKQITPEQEQNFFTAPLSATRELVQQELQQALAPLMGFVQGFQKESTYTRNKNALRASNPKFKELLAQNEDLVDQMMQGVDPTEANITAALFQAHGLRAAGLVPQNATVQPVSGPINTPPSVINNPTSTQTQPNLTIPPHLRPSSPPAPTNRETSPKRIWSENERRLMRELNMTEKEFAEGQIANEDNVGALILEPETTVKPRRNSNVINNPKEG